MATFVTQDLQKILEFFGDGCSNLSWTLTSEKGQYSLCLKWFVGALPRDIHTGANHANQTHQILDNSQSAGRHTPKQAFGNNIHQKPAPRHQYQTPARKHKCPSTIKRDQARRAFWLENKRLNKIDLVDPESETHPESTVYQPPVIPVTHIPGANYEVLEQVAVDAEPASVKSTTTSVDSVDKPEPTEGEIVDSVDKPAGVVSVDNPEAAQVNSVDPEPTFENPPESDDDEYSVPPESLSTNLVSGTPDPDTDAPETSPPPVTHQVLENTTPEPVSHQALDTKNNIPNPVETDHNTPQWIPLGTPTVCKKYKVNNSVDSNKIDHQQNFEAWITHLSPKGADRQCLRLPVVIGRSFQECDLVIRNPQVDLVQCKVHTNGNQVLVTSLSCDNPILINQCLTPLASEESVKLSHGDILTFANKHNFRIDYPLH